MSDEVIKHLTTSDNSRDPILSCIGNKTRVKLDGGCLKQDKITFTHEKTVNIYIAYEINLCDREYDYYPTLENSLFSAVKLVKRADIGKYKYSGYGIGFDRRGTFSVGNGVRKNVIIFGVDVSSFVHVDNKKKDNLILDEGHTQGLDDTTLTPEKSIQSILQSLERNFTL